MSHRHPRSSLCCFAVGALAASSLAYGCSDSDVAIIGPGVGSSSEAGGTSTSPGMTTPASVEPSSSAPAEPSGNDSEGAGPLPLDPTPASASGSEAMAPPSSSPPPEPSNEAEPPNEPAPSAPNEPAPSAPSEPAPSVPSEPAPPVPLPSSPGVPNCEPAAATSAGLRLTELATGLDQPTFVTTAPGDDTRMFVLERSGSIRVVRDGQLLPEPFLRLNERVETSNEEGLIGLAFHPRYQENGRFFVQYALLDPSRAVTEDRQVVLSELVRSAEDPERADPDSERILMVVEQPADIHLGGMLAFHPTDGLLYISRGDGGSNAQDLDSPLGKMLRIDVDDASDERPYGIPAGNLSGDGVLPEIWSLGLRNPWRFAFDACTSDIYIGDVGESSFEEIDFEPANTPGRNYGWKTLEGPQCFDATATCDATGFAPPVLSLDRGFGCAVISGYVYRGHRIPALRGTYLYADYCFGNFGSLRVENGQAVDVRDITDDINPDGVSLITSFGVDNAGELYVASQLGGLYRIDPE